MGAGGVDRPHREDPDHRLDLRLVSGVGPGRFPMGTLPGLTVGTLGGP